MVLEFKKRAEYEYAIKRIKSNYLETEKMINDLAEFGFEPIFSYSSNNEYLIFKRKRR